MRKRVRLGLMLAVAAALLVAGCRQAPNYYDANRGLERLGVRMVGCSQSGTRVSCNGTYKGKRYRWSGTQNPRHRDITLRSNLRTNRKLDVVQFRDDDDSTYKLCTRWQSSTRYRCMEMAG